MYLSNFVKVFRRFIFSFRTFSFVVCSYILTKHILDKMSTLGDIAKIEHNITNSQLPAVKALHVIAYGEEGQPRKTRKHLREFQGFKLDIASNEYAQKISDAKQKVGNADLISICHILDLDYQGTSDELVTRVCTFLNNLNIDENESADEEEEDEDSYEEDEEGEDDDDQPLANLRRAPHTAPTRSARSNQNKTGSFALTFRDVEDSIRSFDGKADYPVEKWINDFEEMAEVTGWNDLQKLIFAKKSLKGIAKLFVQSEKGIKSWKTLKQRLIGEFQVKVSSIQVHKLLMSRTKKREESVQEYVLVMREIGSRANVENEVLIQCIIDGIPDDVSNKVILYGARNFAEFKEKVKLYEQMKAGRSTATMKGHLEVQKKYQGQDFRRELKSKSEVYKTREVKCFNCGENGHKSIACPNRNKGTKCFNCSNFGHVSAKCPKKKPVNVTVNAIESVPKNSVNLDINGVQLIALFDTGSDITALREDIVEKYFADIPIDQEKMAIKGIGQNKVLTLGSFCQSVTINDETLFLKFHIIPTEASNFKAIIGNDILSQVNVTMKDDGIILSRKEKDNFLMQMTLEKEVETEEIDLSHIKDLKMRQNVHELMSSYKPEKCKSTDIKMTIVLKNDEPIYQSPRRLAIPEKSIVEDQIEEWLKEGIIKPSSSDYASPIVLVKKKDGQTRICCDYRKINQHIVKDRFPLPLIEDVLDKLQGAKYFSAIDLRNGFFHVLIADESTKYTSFVTHNGQFEFLKCPFGLCNSPAVFQRFIAHIFRDLSMRNIVVYYMDDLIVLSENEEQGIERLRLVLEVARDYGLEIKRKKCQILQRKVQFLGVIIEDGKVQPSSEKSDAISKYPKPTTVKQVQAFLGLTGYFRKFIPSYSVIAKPLSDLLKKERIFQFGENEEQAFETLKQSLSSQPVLCLYKQGAETELHTDASKFGYGACLMQKSDDNKLHPVYYMSKKTTPAEERYSSYELEVLAVIQAVKKFRIYLLGIQFRIVTDCAAFQCTMKKKDLTTRVARWALLLEEYSYEIVHRRGSQMAHVDALSRHPIDVMIMTELISEEDGMVKRIQNAQEKDEHIDTIKKILEADETYNNYFLKNGIVYKYMAGQENLVVPKAMQNEIIKKAHDIGHFSVVKTEEVVKREFYIPKVKEKIQGCIRNCIPCILGSKKEGKKEGWLHPLPKLEGPLHTYHIDHLGPIMSTSKNYKHILVIVDDFSKFVWLYATKSTTAKEVVECLTKQQKIFGNPSRIISDRGTAFTAEEFENYCSEENIKHILITTGVPRSNGQVERINRILIPVITKLSLEDPTKWYKCLNSVQRALNSTVQRSINLTPFEVLLGTKMRSKDDICIKELLEREVVNEFDAYREKMREDAKKQILKVQEENRGRYNLRRRKPKGYKKGDLVAIKRTQFGPNLKVSRKFLGPYEITKDKGNERYDVVKVGHHEGPIRTSTCAEYLKPWVENQSESESDSGSDGRV